MSINRCSIECDCDLWRFQTERSVAIDDSSLLTEGEYLTAIGCDPSCYRNLGRGYEVGQEGERFLYYEPSKGPYPPSGTFKDRPNDEEWAWRGCSSGPHGVYQEPRLIGRYLPVPLELRYRFRRIECALCRRLYVGWYRRDPHNELSDDPADGPRYELYDTSFWHSFNDKPREKDLERLVEWSPEQLAEFVRLHNERSDLQRGKPWGLCSALLNCIKFIRDNNPTSALTEPHKVWCRLPRSAELEKVEAK